MRYLRLIQIAKHPHVCSLSESVWQERQRLATLHSPRLPLEKIESSFKRFGLGVSARLLLRYWDEQLAQARIRADPGEVSLGGYLPRPTESGRWDQLLNLGLREKLKTLFAIVAAGRRRSWRDPRKNWNGTWLQRLRSSPHSFARKSGTKVQR